MTRATCQTSRETKSTAAVKPNELVDTLQKSLLLHSDDIMPGISPFSRARDERRAGGIYSVVETYCLKGLPAAPVHHRSAASRLIGPARRAASLLSRPLRAVFGFTLLLEDKTFVLLAPCRQLIHDSPKPHSAAGNATSLLLSAAAVSCE